MDQDVITIQTSTMTPLSATCKVHFISCWRMAQWLLLDFSLTVKAATLIFISGCGSAISSAKEGKSGLIYNLVKS